MSHIWKVPGVEVEDLIENSRRQTTKEFALQLAVQLWHGQHYSPEDVTNTADHFLKWLEAGEAKEVGGTE